MTKWKCSTCGWIYDPAQGDPEIEIGHRNGLRGSAGFLGLPHLWVRKRILRIGRLGARIELSSTTSSLWMITAQNSLPSDINMYKERFENVFRVAQKLTSSLNIGEVLEMIRDEARATLPQLQEVCLLVIDPEAQYYTRPLHCAVEKQRINCQLCKRGRGTVDSALGQASSAVCFLPDELGGHLVADGFPPDGFSEIVFPIYEGDKPLAVLDAIARPGSRLRRERLHAAERPR